MKTTRLHINNKLKLTLRLKTIRSKNPTSRSNDITILKKHRRSLFQSNVLPSNNNTKRPNENSPSVLSKETLSTCAHCISSTNCSSCKPNLVAAENEHIRSRLIEYNHYTQRRLYFLLL